MGEFVFALVIDHMKALHAALRRVFTDPAVASYQIGFGPPLIRSSARLIERTKAAKSALEKLEAYLDCCFLEESERARLFGEFRRIVVRQLGAVEAEVLDEKSADVLDLSVRVRGPGDTPPEALTGRFRIKLGDPRNTRLLELESVRALAIIPEKAAAIEFRVPVGARAVFAAMLAKGAADGAFSVAEVGEPVSHAKT